MIGLRVVLICSVTFRELQISEVVKLVFPAEQISEVEKLLFSVGRLIFHTVRHFYLVQLCSQYCLMKDVAWLQMVKRTHLLCRYLMID
jgi:hypothetical protein